MCSRKLRLIHPILVPRTLRRAPSSLKVFSSLCIETPVFVCNWRSPISPNPTGAHRAKVQWSPPCAKVPLAIDLCRHGGEWTQQVLSFNPTCWGSSFLRWPGCVPTWQFQPWNMMMKQHIQGQWWAIDFLANRHDYHQHQHSPSMASWSTMLSSSASSAPGHSWAPEALRSRLGRRFHHPASCSSVLGCGNLPRGSPVLKCIKSPLQRWTRLPHHCVASWMKSVLGRCFWCYF